MPRKKHSICALVGSSTLLMVFFLPAYLPTGDESTVMKYKQSKCTTIDEDVFLRNPWFLHVIFPHSVKLKY